MNFDPRSEFRSLHAHVHHEPEQIAVGNLELNDITRGKLERRRDADTRLGNVSDLPWPRLGWLDEPGDAHVDVGRETVFETAVHGFSIGRSL